MGERRYWAMRMDVENRELLVEELRRGRLRQGWGWDDRQDLRRIEERAAKGRKLVQVERVARLARRMASDDGIRPGDLVVVPRYPDDGRFLVVEVAGPYEFDPIELVGDRDVNGLGRDYGHILPVKLPRSNPTPVLSSDVLLSAGLKRSLTCRSRLWCLDEHAEVLDGLWERLVAGEYREVPWDAANALQSMIDVAMTHVRGPLEAALLKELDHGFAASHLELVVLELLRHAYPGAEVQHTGGPKEHGADVVVRWSDPLSDEQGLDWTLLVQVKCWRGMADDVHPLKQLEHAIKHYRADGDVRAARVYTLCEGESEGFAARREELSQKTGVPVGFVDERGFLRQLRELAMRRAAVG